MDTPTVPAWDHDGRGQGGKRAYMFSTCFDCLMDEVVEDRKRAEACGQEEPLAAIAWKANVAS